MKYNRFLPLLIPIIVYLFFQLVYFNPRSLYVALAFITILILISYRQLLFESEKGEKWYNLVLLPLYLSVACLLMSILVPIDDLFGKFLIQGLYLLVAVILYHYFRYAYYYLIIPTRYKKNSLEFFSSYANFLAVYLASSAIFGLQSFLNVPVWILMIAIMIFISMVVYEVMWVNRIIGPASYFYIALICLSLFEISWAVSFLTLSHYIIGLLIAISYYVLIGLVRFHMLKSLNKRIIKTYLSLGLISIIVVLLSARWM